MRLRTWGAVASFNRQFWKHGKVVKRYKAVDDIRNCFTIIVLTYYHDVIVLSRK